MQPRAEFDMKLLTWQKLRHAETKRMTKSKLSMCNIGEFIRIYQQIWLTVYVSWIGQSMEVIVKRSQYSTWTQCKRPASRLRLYILHLSSLPHGFALAGACRGAEHWLLTLTASGISRQEFIFASLIAAGWDFNTEVVIIIIQRHRAWLLPCPI